MPRLSDQTLFVLSGPTAVGKTELALAWAEKFGAEIVSCDSLLFYRGMDIGTAKPSRAEQTRVAHHLIDVCEISDQMDVSRYLSEARRVVGEIAARGHRVLVVGGSGFYLKSFFEPVADEVCVAPELREEIGAKLEKNGLSALVADLRRLNPAGIGVIDTDNPRRIVRALERCRASGRTLADLTQSFAELPKPFPEWKKQCVILERDPDELSVRVEKRVTAMLQTGLVDEVRQLLELGLAKNPSAAKAIGYRETIAMLAGKLPQDQLAPSIVQNTKALIKKQRTWFRTQTRPHRNVSATTATVAELFSVAFEVR